MEILHAPLCGSPFTLGRKVIVLAATPMAVVLRWYYGGTTVVHVGR